MKVLLVAPRICSPWTEGRKNFVRDLISAATGRWQLCGLVTLDAGETTSLPASFTTFEVSDRKDHLLLLTAQLADAIAQHQPNLVCHFPFGAFTGLRGIANLWVIGRIAAICRKMSVPCCTIMYSLTAETRSPLHRWLLRDVYFNQYADHGRRIRFGVSLPAFTPLHDPASKTLLFMAGAAEPTAERLDYVLDVRGLRLLLLAGVQLAERGYRLIVAVPLLADPAMRQLLLQHPDNRWPTQSLLLQTEVRIPETFRGIQTFVFPYGQEETQFVPTSIVEAMHFGIPVVLPRLDFLTQFHTNGTLAAIYPPGDCAGLIDSIERLSAAPQTAVDMAERARKFVASEYAIDNTVADIEAIHARLSGTGCT